MGQKVNPVGMRIGINRDWNTHWYANNKDFSTYLLEDIAIRKYITKVLNGYRDTKNKEVKIMGLGTFSVKHKNERVGRNPKTGKEAVIEARNVISFRPAKNLKDSLN